MESIIEEIKEDLTNLIKLGVQIESITTDGHKSILKAIKKSIPDVVVQRCLVHIQRMCLLWLTRFPKHLAGVELRQLVLMLMRIKTENDRIYWTRELEGWYDQASKIFARENHQPANWQILVYT